MSVNGQIEQIVRLHLPQAQVKTRSLKMEREKQDRRTRKTRQLLRNALLALLKEKRYAEISVQDIIERADVARSTFYVHYVDKDDLLTGGKGIFAANLGQHMVAHTAEKAEPHFSSGRWFYHIKTQAPILKLIARDSALELAMKTLRDIIRLNVQEGLQAHAQVEREDIPLSLLVDYVTGTLMVLIEWWLRDGMKYTPEQMDEIFQQLVMPGVLSIRSARKNDNQSDPNLHLKNIK